ncbi:hypothetical protein DPEC_G00250540 [Dallia pectoralis]|uniref:Uncharacterized protein n=1 Tax=Dallia pectoralis TaxID=75939 RepID=A0ACC2FT65_DALPE|nr:hypothetical protein DPEC_G00250540 [Dallia pectoralis]
MLLCLSVCLFSGADSSEHVEREGYVLVQDAFVAAWFSQLSSAFLQIGKFSPPTPKPSTRFSKDRLS